MLVNYCRKTCHQDNLSIVALKCKTTWQQNTTSNGKSYYTRYVVSPQLGQNIIQPAMILFRKKLMLLVFCNLPCVLLLHVAICHCVLPCRATRPMGRRQVGRGNVMLLAEENGKGQGVELTFKFPTYQSDQAHNLQNLKYLVLVFSGVLWSPCLDQPCLCSARGIYRKSRQVVLILWLVQWGKKVWWISFRKAWPFLDDYRSSMHIWYKTKFKWKQ